MTKRVLSLIIALILPIVMLCGCSAKQLTADEYQDEVISNVKNWFKAMDDWVIYCSDNVIVETADKSYEMDFDKAREHKSELKKTLNSVEDALDKIDKIGNPPAEYADFHKQLKNGVSLERKWLSLQRETLSARSEEEFKAAAKAIEDHVDSTADDALPKIYLEEIKNWNIDVGNLW